jgi:alpha-galactosidase
MRPPKIVLIGAASGSFGPPMVADAVLTPEVRGARLVLVDLDADRLTVVQKVAERLSEACGADLTIEATTDRRAALPGADFVIVSVAVRRFELWRQEFEIPLRHGIRQVLGENGGPGGLFHALRNIPLLLSIGRDVEELAPQALLINFTNPLSRICLALHRATRLRWVGLCHGIGMGVRSVARITGLDPDLIVPRAAGINHFTWMLTLTHRQTGEDLYPLLRQRHAVYDPSFQPLSRALFERIGLYPSPSDDHIGEYLPFAWEYCGLEGYDFAEAERRRAARWQELVAIAEGRRPVDRREIRPSGELAFPIIAGILSNTPRYLDAVNLPNDGHIANLPKGAIVEVPGVATADGVHGLAMGELPPAVVGWIQAQLAVQELVVEAALTGSRQVALQALLADPVVDSVRAAERVLDELLALERAYLPQFQ